MNKEFRVFIVNNLDYDEVSRPTSDWFKDGKPSEEALIFMELAEDEGRVYSLQGFQEAFNSGTELSEEVDFVLITDKY